ncbi:MAG TPA: IPT/TIG domain-containing protein [Nitrospira sp.]|nr:IPT/TIG domain-containing protein [Nitrospira sp.]
MTVSMSGQRSARYLWVIVGLIGVLLCVSSKADAKSSSAPSSAAAKAAACDYRSRPTITTVTPNHAKPGQKITIIGKNFGAKSCFHSVSFGSKSTDAYTYVSPTTVEATVPNLLPGSVPVTVSTEAGMSQFKLEVQAQ